MCTQASTQRLLLAAVFAAMTSSAFAFPKVEAVQAEVNQGHYTHAEAMMREVLAAKPDSAKAHYIYAEILAHDGHFDQAAREATTARTLDPSLHFTQPERYRAFSQLLQREQAPARRATLSTHAEQLAPALQPEQAVSPAGAGLPPWAMGLGFAALALIAWHFFGVRRQAAAPGGLGAPATAGPGMPGGAGASAYSPSYNPGYSAPMAGPAAGHGLLGTGLAVAGGVAAGMLAEKLLDGSRTAAWGASSAAGLGGLTPGLINSASAQDDAARELEERPIDFGDGDGDGDGWGGRDSNAGSAEPDASSDGGGW